MATIEELETEETLLSSLIETISEDPIPNNVFTIEDTDNMILLGKLNEVVASLEDIDATITASDAKANTALESATIALSTSNSASETAINASSTADTAIATANTAIESANTALENSIDAVDAADTANTNASNAVITANSADNKADTAISTANSADSKADTAITTANGADTKADTAISTANGADSKADTAIATANTADSNATFARGVAENAEDNSITAINTADNAEDLADDAKTIANQALDAVLSGLGTKVTFNDVLQSVVDFTTDPQTQFNTLSTNLYNETLTRIANDNTIEAGLASERNTRESQDIYLENKINTEIVNRQNADTTLQTNINSEASARASADTNLQNQKIGGNTNYGGTVVDNLNNITKSGFYTCYGTAIGVPNATYSWYILHENSNVGDVRATQKAVAYTALNPIIYIRVKSTTWSGWEQLVSLKLTQTLSNKTLASPNITTALNLNGNALGSAGGLDYIVAKSIAVNGYIKYASGLIIQWGTYGRTSVATPTITFPLTFPNNCWIVVAGRTIDNTNRDTFAVAVKRDMTTRSNFTAFKQPATDRGFDWIAIGN